MIRILVAILFNVAIIVGPSAQAGVPNWMNNQGVLRTAAGTPVADGAYNLTFALYASASTPTPLWIETVPAVAVQGGLYSTVLGAVTPFPAELFREHASLWLGVTVGTGAELPRARLLTLAYAFEADHALLATTAEALTCTDCVDEGALGFDLCTATAGCAPTLQAGTGLTLDGTTFNVKQATVTDWAKLACYDTVTELRTALDAVYAPLAHAHAGTDITSPVAECIEAQNAQALEGNSLAQVEDAVLDAVTAAGYLKNTDKIGAAQLPANGLDEVSNGLLTNQFQDASVAADTPVPIRDYYPLGVSSTLTIPSVGTAEKLTVSVDLANSDVSGITVTLTDPVNVQYVLYDRGSAGPALQATYPDPTATVSGDLTTWTGKDPAGQWKLTVIDSHFDGGTDDGQINNWSMAINTLSESHVRLHGNIDMDGHSARNLASPIAPDDAATKGYIDARIEQSMILANESMSKTTDTSIGTIVAFELTVAPSTTRYIASAFRIESNVNCAPSGSWSETSWVLTSGGQTESGMLLRCYVANDNSSTSSGSEISSIYVPTEIERQNGFTISLSINAARGGSSYNSASATLKWARIMKH